MKRVLCLHIPYLTIDRLRRPCSKPLDKRRSDQRSDGRPNDGQAADSRGAIVIVEPAAGGLRVVQGNPQAYRCGVRPGHTLAESCALAPGLEVHHQDLADDRRALEALAVWAECLSPVVQIEGQEALLIDVTGCRRLFGSEEAIVSGALAGLRGQGYTAVAAIADTPGAAWALAHADGRRVIVVPSGGVAASISHLPVWSLRVEPDTVAKLRTVGVATIEALLDLPRASLAARFGGGLLRRVDQALGDAPEPLTPFRQRPAIRASLRFAAATDQLDFLYQALDRAVAMFCRQLDRKMLGTRQVHVTFHFPPAMQRTNHQTFTLEVSRSTRDPAHLRSLAEVRLDALKLRAKVTGLVIWTRQVENLDGVQQSWFDTEGDDESELAGLIDRLAVRLGQSSVVRARHVDDYQPEMAYEYVKATATKGARGQPKGSVPFSGVRRPILPSVDCKLSDADSRRPAKGTDPWGDMNAAARPLRLLAHPVAVPVIAVVPDGPPGRFRYNGADHRIVRWSGPERLETGWWRQQQVRRDYYCVESDKGCRYWLFRERHSRQWFVHGFFD